MPEKSEVIVFLDQPIQIVRKFRARRLTLSIRPDRVRLTSNMTTSQSEMLDFLRSHTNWIQKNLTKMKSFEETYQKPKLEAGALFPFLGELKYFTFANSRRARVSFAVEDGFLICYRPVGAQSHEVNSAALERALFNFYKKSAVEYLQSRLPLWVERTRLQPKKLKFNRATTRWGSCSSSGQINLNWKLICHAPHLIDYVIVHELCHLKLMNHSDSFWDLVAEFMPEYKIYEKTLDEQVGLSRFLNA